MEKAEIEARADTVLRRMHARRAELWPGRTPHPLEYPDPELAGRVLGVDLTYTLRLAFSVPGAQYETAGVLDRNRRSIVVATRFGEEVARFTAAHEIGHWDLHPDGEKLHRDMPISGTERNARNPQEREADQFAAAFLMPPRLVRRIFRSMFLTDSEFVFNDTTAYLLRPYDVPSLLYPAKGSRIRETVLATAKSFNGVRFEKSLAEMFHVSVATMAGRLNELGLVRGWP